MYNLEFVSLATGQTQDLIFCFKIYVEKLTIENIRARLTSSLKYGKILK